VAAAGRFRQPDIESEAALLAPCLDKYAYLGKLMKTKNRVRQAATISLEKSAIRRCGHAADMPWLTKADVRIATAEAW
jgi:hypothetical protein